MGIPLLDPERRSGLLGTGPRRESDARVVAGLGILILACFVGFCIGFGMAVLIL